jgi:hypothetical protein
VLLPITTLPRPLPSGTPEHVKLTPDAYLVLVSGNMIKNSTALEYIVAEIKAFLRPFSIDPTQLVEWSPFTILPQRVYRVRVWKNKVQFNCIINKLNSWGVS